MSDFAYTPDFTLTEEPTFKTDITEYENGVEQRRKAWASARREWKLVFKNRTLTEINLIKSFFLGKYGAFSSFTWTNPNDSTEYTVRFKQDSFVFERKGYNAYDAETVFIQVL